MQDFTERRRADTADEIWLLEHEPVFTLGRNGKAEHILSHTNIPIVNIDRGGQVTYHGPGQLIAYLMIDLKRRDLGVRQLVTLIEQSIISTLKEYDLSAAARPDAPGVYINNAKIAALGLRIKKGCSFHGLSINIDMDLSPFQLINPCGYENLEVVQLCDYIESINISQFQQQLIFHLSKHLSQHQGYDEIIWQSGFSE